MDSYSPREPDSAQRGSWGPLLVVLLLVALAVYGVGMYRGDWPVPWQRVVAEAPQVPEYPPAPPRVGAGPIDAQAVTADVSPALVDVDVTVEPLGLAGSGSGIVLTDTGQVVTSHHVIKGAGSISVTDVGTGATYDATPMGYDSTHDIALLQLDGAQQLPTARIGASSEVAVGDQVAAIGNAGGVGGAPTSVVGATTGLDATIVARNDADFSRKFLTDLIEVEADVEPGQSGGSLVNRVGQVIGVITAASAGSSGASTPSDDAQAGSAQPAERRRGFAVPIDQAMGIVEDIRAGKASETVHIGPTATLGVLVSDSDRGQPAGAHVDAALWGKAADRAGLEEGDLITAIGGKPISSARDLRTVISGHRPGDSVQFGWTTKGGAQRAVDITLEDGPPN